MPAFTFEKISSPIRATPTSATTTKQVAAKKSRSLIVQMLDRVAIARLQRDADLTPQGKRPPPT